MPGPVGKPAGAPASHPMDRINGGLKQFYLQRAAKSNDQGDSQAQTSYLLHKQGDDAQSEIYKQKAIDSYLQANAQRDSAATAKDE